MKLLLKFLKKIIFIFIITGLTNINLTTYGQGQEDIIYEKNTNINSWFKNNNWKEILLKNKFIDFIERKSSWDIYKKIILLNKIKKQIKNYPISENYWISNILDNIEYKLKEDIDLFENNTQEVILWYSSSWNPIKWYFRWNPNLPFFWIFANIHWSYEYWTYHTSFYLKDIFEQNNKKQWFIIPSINIDWLNIAQFNNYSKEYFLEWRSNINNVDLNRNFCTSDYKNWNYIKISRDWKENTKIQKWNYCWDQNETITIMEVLKKYHFSTIIDLHSAWWILFIPNNSINDSRIVDLWNSIKNILWENYDFNINYKNSYEKKFKIKKYEVNEWWIWNYTWLMIQYIYEKYNIPTIIIEIENHWEIEYKLSWIKDLF